MHSHETDHGQTIHPYLPVQRGNVRIPNIIVINAILYVMESGRKRRALPKCFGNWSTVYARFRHWSCCDVFERLFAALREQHVNRRADLTAIDLCVQLLFL